MKSPSDLLSRLLDGIVTERPLLVGSGAGELAARLEMKSGPVTMTGMSAGSPADALTGGAASTTPTAPPATGGLPPPAARALPFEQPFRDRSFDLAVIVALTEPLPSPARSLVEMRRVSSRYVLAIVAGARLLDEERLAGLMAAAGLRLRKTARGPDGLIGALAERLA